MMSSTSAPSHTSAAVDAEPDELSSEELPDDDVVEDPSSLLDDAGAPLDDDASEDDAPLEDDDDGDPVDVCSAAVLASPSESEAEAAGVSVSCTHAPRRPIEIARIAGKDRIRRADAAPSRCDAPAYAVVDESDPELLLELELLLDEDDEEDVESSPVVVLLVASVSIVVDASPVVVGSIGPLHNPLSMSHVASSLQQLAFEVHHKPARFVRTHSARHVNASSGGRPATDRSRSATQNMPSPQAVHSPASQHASTVPVVLVVSTIVVLPISDVDSGGGGGIPSVR